ncbi:hypothetical protein AYI68_g1113 [Smittium mucronatum]|uniref:Endonuclease/exonuclease/phosphatase domain-containing protein n=1 Tax=Smittium mucronatum TaxID=133383 RepID=A0A1R0H6K5_9FUNG|nr:hypothetical protein AYI68_g1113 [Smittium mucronatum]
MQIVTYSKCRKGTLGHYKLPPPPQIAPKGPMETLEIFFEKDQEISAGLIMLNKILQISKAKNKDSEDVIKLAPEKPTEEAEMKMAKNGPISGVNFPQRDLLNKKLYRCRLNGYTAIESKADFTKGGWGLLIAVKKSIGLELREFKSEPSWLAGTVSGTSSNGQKFTLLVTNAHIPNVGVRRKRAVGQLQAEFQKICKNFKSLILLGDLNMNVQASRKFTPKLGVGLELAKVSNSSGSRWNKNTFGRMIDHIFYTEFNCSPNSCISDRKLDISVMNGTF